MKPSATRRISTGVLAAVLVAAAALAYAGSLAGPFVFDDLDSIVANPTIRQLWPLGPVLSPPYAEGQTVGGRPVLNLSLAVNYALGGTRVSGYHAANLLIHVLAGLTLLGIARRTFRRLGGSAADRADLLGLAIALLWTVHPLQTEAVTYVIQRAESLAGLFYLLTLYAFIRGAEAEERGGLGASLAWFALSWLACLLGMGTKEVMASAPVIVLLYDRTFLSGSLVKAWRRHRGILAGLAATWLLLARLILDAHGRGGTVGGEVAVSWAAYLLTQGPAILHYLRLAFWPHPLVFDYGATWLTVGQAAPAVAVVLLLLAATFSWLWRRTAGGFLAAWFFAVLAPTSLVPGIRQTLAEHRMYLALAPLLAGVVGGIGLWPGWSGRGAARIGGGLLVAVGGVLAWLTFSRNEAYRTDLALWTDTVARRPGNPYAHNDLGQALRSRGRTAEAAIQFEEALRLKPDLPEAANNLGNIRWEEGRRPEAVALYRRALSLRPRYAEAENNLGVADTALGRLDDAIAEFDSALAIEPGYAEAGFNRGVALAAAGRLAEAVAAYETALVWRPDFPEARLNLGVALARGGRVGDALVQFREVIRERPDYADAHLDAANALVYAGQLAEAAAEYQATLRLRPGDEAARTRLARVQAALAAGGRAP
jgi:tetratricopeptide (TPR) repeat protein